MTSPQELDGGIDERDRDEVEAQLAAAVAAMLAAKAATAPWLALVEGSLSGLLRDYLRRSSLDMATSAGLSPTEATRVADEATDSVLGDVQHHAASWLKIAADDRSPKDGSPMDRDDAEQAAGIIARTLATYAREKVREAVATKLGTTKRRWQTRMDSRVRFAHKQLEGQWKPLGIPFKVGGFELMYPGDPTAPLDLQVGCRCHLVYLSQ